MRILLIDTCLMDYFTMVHAVQSVKDRVLSPLEDLIFCKIAAGWNVRRVWLAGPSTCPWWTRPFVRRTFKAACEKIAVGLEMS